MEPTLNGEKRFALLIDADNVSAKYLQPILDELSNYGTVTYKRIYGDWTLASHVKWKKVLLENSITPIQQFGYTQGKNATDSAMIIDAMDILYAGGVEGFCIVSSDSDFTRLAVRLRESGRMVIGMGEKKTPIPFRKACDIFTTLELLLKDHRKQDSENVTSRQEIERAVVDIIVTNQNNGKGTGLGEVGSRLQKRYPDFDVRNYGTNVLSNLLESFESVRIIKSRNNVAVLLAEDAETLAELEEKRAAHDVAKHLDIEAAAEAVAEAAAAIEEVAHATAAEEDSEEEEDGKFKKRRRKRRSSRKVRDERVRETEGDEAEAAEAANTTEVVEVAETPVEEPVEAFNQVEAPEPIEAAAEVEPAEATETPDKPRRKKRTNTKRGGKGRNRKAEVAEVTEAAEPKASEAKPAEDKQAEDKPANAATKANSFIMSKLNAVGEEGIPVANLSKAVRNRFKDFKVRELGFQHLRAYLDSLGFVEIQKQGNDFIAKIKK